MLTLTTAKVTVKSKRGKLVTYLFHHFDKSNSISEQTADQILPLGEKNTIQVAVMPDHFKIPYLCSYLDLPADEQGLG